VADLSITALYTAETWAWGRLSCAELFASAEGKRVFDATNAVLGLARRVRRDWAPLRESLLQRHVLIDRIARSAGARRIVELAAGLSPRGAAFTRDPELTYVEIDLPVMIERKRALLARTDEGRAVLARKNLALVADDVRTADLREYASPGTLVIAEGLLMYLDAAAQASLFARVREVASRFVFDLVPGAEEPPPGAIGRTLGAVMKLATGGGGFERDRRTRDDLLAALDGAGWHARAIDASAVARAEDLPYPDAPTRTVIFDALARTAPVT
jgi:O-methyltransferase involved in polyketide biosynthesis